MCLSLEQLHSQSPILFQIVFGINFDSVFRYLLNACCSVSPVVWACAALRGPLRRRTVAVCGFGSWALVFHCRMPRQISHFPPTPLKQKCAPRREKAKDRRLFTIQRYARISTSYQFADPGYRLPLTALQAIYVIILPRLSTASKDCSVVSQSQRLSVRACQRNPAG